jgi:D-tyrosyl-tRNA(Tyr) deacylase
MRAVVQRVAEAAVRVDGEVVGRIGAGLLVLLGVGQGDQESDAEYLAEKILNLRIFADAEGQMNLSVLDARGELLAVSQFTLYADTRRGRRPGYSAAAPPEEASRLYRYFVGRLRESGLRVEEGVFRAMMDVSLVNRGPVTILLDSAKTF